MSESVAFLISMSILSVLLYILLATLISISIDMTKSEIIGSNVSFCFLPIVLPIKILQRILMDPYNKFKSLIMKIY